MPAYDGTCVIASRDDERFRIQLGAPKRPDGSQSGQRAQRFVSQVLKQVSKTGAKTSGARGARPASTFGRGRVAAGMAGHRLKADARRVTIKSRFVVLKKAGANSISTHLRYIERDADPAHVESIHGARSSVQAIQSIKPI
jgi:hypothetical protein